MCNDKPQYTFKDPSGSKSRIDYIWVSKDISHKIKQSVLRHAPQKDKHKAVQIGLNLQNNPRGRGHWKLNSKLLELQEYEDMVRHIKQDCLNNYQDFDHTSRWELFKIKTQESSIKFGIERAKRNEAT